MSESIRVGMGDLKITKYPNNLITIGLGSCVGVCIYDSSTKILAMAHVMLPEANNSVFTNIGKFADIAIPFIIKEMIRLGANKNKLIAKIAGGASMFKTENDFMKIGKRNIESVKKGLVEYRIPIVGEETEGSIGRTIEFYSDNGRLEVRTYGKEIITL